MGAVVTPAELEAKDVLTPDEVAALLSVVVETVRDWLTAGVTISTQTGRRRVALAGRKCGGRWRIRRADLDAFIRTTTEASSSPDALPAGLTLTAAEQRRRAEDDLRDAYEAVNS